MSGLDRLAEAVQWLVGVGAAAAVVMLFTLDGAESPDAAATPEPVSEEPLSDEPVPGELLYAEHCSSCHGIDGSGGQGPRLAGTMETLYPDPADQAAFIRRGGAGMPGFDDLTDDEIDRIVAHTRTALG